jgi:alpha-glucosidase
VEVQRADPGSVLHLYRRLLQARRSSTALSVGDQRMLEAPDGVLAWRRAHGPDERMVMVNMGALPVTVDLTGTVEVASDGRDEGLAFGGTLAPDTAVILR